MAAQLPNSNNQALGRLVEGGHILEIPTFRQGISATELHKTGRVRNGDAGPGPTNQRQVPAGETLEGKLEWPEILQ